MSATTDIGEQVMDMIADGEINRRMLLGRVCGCGSRADAFCHFYCEWLCMPCLNNDLWPDGQEEKEE
jgi:hypothetical protein